MNNNNALPLAADAKVSTFSNSSVNLVYGGTGSGNIDASTADTLRTALEKVGVTVNPTLWGLLHRRRRQGLRPLQERHRCHRQ